MSADNAIVAAKFSIPMRIFKDLKAACNEETTEQTQLWMVYKVHGMWERQEITDNQFAVLIDKIMHV
jgi:hypothetical protein